MDLHADVSGSFIKQLDNHESVEYNSADQPPSDNSVVPAADTDNPLEDSLEEENFDLIKRYWTGIPPSRRPL